MAAISSMVYSIKYDFVAEEPTELAVHAGEMVRAPDNAHMSREPWMLVETVSPPFNRGFVPTSYLVPQGQLKQQHQDFTPTGTTNSSSGGLFQGGMGSGPRVRRLSDPRLSHQLLDVLSINPPEMHEPPTAAMQQYELALRPFQTEHANIFSMHDRFMQQIMHQRSEQTRVLDEIATDVTHRLEATKSKASEIAQAMVEINAVIEAERKRWRERLAADAATLASVSSSAF